MNHSKIKRRVGGGLKEITREITQMYAEWKSCFCRSEHAGKTRRHTHVAVPSAELDLRHIHQLRQHLTRGVRNMSNGRVWPFKSSTCSLNHEKPMQERHHLNLHTLEFAVTSLCATDVIRPLSSVNSSIPVQCNPSLNRHLG